MTRAERAGGDIGSRMGFRQVRPDRGHAREGGMEDGNETRDAAEERGPGLAVALALMVVGALGASVWWGIVVAVLLLRC